MELVTKRDMDDAEKLGGDLGLLELTTKEGWQAARHDVAQAIADGRRAELAGPLRCAACDEKVREVAQQADLVAFWAYQAKSYYAHANKLGTYDELPLEKQKEIEAVFEKARIEENRERIGHVPDSYDIGS